ncbi:hypothetical protein ACOMICROBIO_FLGHMIGD_00126 [Vibrio sp. B1FLJ16]|uniref:AsmA family protein n=1 Tax=Vibrio sp. B1FLJ16 TaxID=2751178 RepID=UPI0015F64316|nr:AsmA family protein [Vibrio sp. B1FLJ16]CAD7797128.1 hypothetical protein ACOMICROBIO_FLGHMIGD_00126 [Vibrio sp. B1FLJ16]CAE6879251.1 hypothetical protein ACOMICROBIO_FLGHMIGD_00126 [Vibrio sp. B1FLJ16]
MKTVLRILILVLVLLLAIPATIIALLTTSYSNQTWAFVSEHLNLPYQAEQVHYDFPYHFKVQGVRTQNEQISYIDKIDVWLNPDIHRDGKWIIDSLLIDGVSLPKGLPPLPKLNTFQFHQIAAKNLDYADGQLVINGVNIQVQSPAWHNNTHKLPYGEIQLSATQIYWNGEALDDVLVDMNHQPENSTLYGASFKWRDSQVSGQGEQYPQGWSLVNVTIDKLKMNNTQFQSLLAKPWQKLPFEINHINSLDLLSADIEWGAWHWQNLELSVEDAELPLSIWNATAQVSLQADSVRFQEQVAIEPRLNASLSPQLIELKELYLDWQQGRIQVSGQFQPAKWQIETASVQGLKWAIQPNESSEWWATATRELEEVEIKRLDIERSQIIQLAQEPYWQLTGLNLEGDQLELKRTWSRWAVWNGKLDASVVNASYNQILSSHAALTTQSNDGLWELTRLFAPLEQGYIEGYGQIDVSTTSQPWMLHLNADGIPLMLFHPYLPDVLAVEGFSDLNLELHGLAGDQNMLEYSLTGSIDANLRNTTLRSRADKSLKAITLSPIRLQMQRGEVSVQPVTISGDAISGQISGDFDLASDPLSGVEYTLQEECGVIKGDIFSKATAAGQCIKPAENADSALDKNPAQPRQAQDADTYTDEAEHPVSHINTERHIAEPIEEAESTDEPATNDITADKALATE